MTKDAEISLCLGRPVASHIELVQGPRGTEQPSLPPFPTSVFLRTVWTQVMGGEFSLLRPARGSLSESP